MQDLEQSDSITVGLIGLLRGRARRMRRMAYGFIAAIIVVISGAITFYFYAPQLATRESAARLTALQERLTQQDELIRQREQDRTALKAEIIQRIQKQETRIFDPVRRANILSSVHFVDEASGWAVGGGTILATSDGGQSWRAQKAQTVQNLRSVHFLDEVNGWAVGDSGTILATTDGGRSWVSKKGLTD